MREIGMNREDYLDHWSKQLELAKAKRAKETVVDRTTLLWTRLQWFLPIASCIVVITYVQQTFHHYGNRSRDKFPANKVGTVLAFIQSSLIYFFIEVICPLLPFLLFTSNFHYFSGYTVMAMFITTVISLMNADKHPRSLAVLAAVSIGLICLSFGEGSHFVGFEKIDLTNKSFYSACEKSLCLEVSIIGLFTMLSLRLALTFDLFPYPKEDPYWFTAMIMAPKQKKY
jgi:hypothetical protein